MIKHFPGRGLNQVIEFDKIDFELMFAKYYHPEIKSSTDHRNFEEMMISGFNSWNSNKRLSPMIMNLIARLNSENKELA
jgi:hypothetical protein